MNIGDLRAAIKNLPDETAIIVDTYEGDFLAIRQEVTTRLKQKEDGDWELDDDGELALVLTPFSDSIFAR